MSSSSILHMTTEDFSSIQIIKGHDLKKQKHRVTQESGRMSMVFTLALFLCLKYRIYKQWSASRLCQYLLNCDTFTFHTETQK